MYRGAAVPWTGLTFCAAEKTLCNFQGYVAHTQARRGQRATRAGSGREQILTFPETPTSTTRGYLYGPFQHSGAGDAQTAPPHTASLPTHRPCASCDATRPGRPAAGLRADSSRRAPCVVKTPPDPSARSQGAQCAPRRARPSRDHYVGIVTLCVLNPERMLPPYVGLARLYPKDQSVVSSSPET